MQEKKDGLAKETTERFENVIDKILEFKYKQILKI